MPHLRSNGTFLDGLMGDLKILKDTPTTIYAQHLRLFVGTWNVGGKAPTRETRESMQEWLMGSHEDCSEHADIYVIGFQEIVPLNAGNILGMNMKDGSDAGLSASNNWEALISATLNKRPTNNHSSKIYCDNDDNANDNVDCTLRTTLTKTPTPICIENFYENNDSKNDSHVASYDEHIGDKSRKPHDHYASNNNSKLQYQYNSTDNTRPCDCYISDDDNDNDNDIDESDLYFLNKDIKVHANGGDYTDIVMTDKYNYSIVQHKQTFLNENDIMPSLASDKWCTYNEVPTAAMRKLFSLCELDSNLDSNLSSDEDVDNCMYTRIARKQMVGLFISVWVRHNLRYHVKDVQVSTVGCGIMNILGNKGSVSVSLSVEETTFCFICSHLNSGGRPTDLSRRNSDVNNILRRTRFMCSNKLQSNINLNLPKNILSHDRIIWLGDLNYRLTLPPKELKTFLAHEDWATLIEKDELKKEKAMGGVFEGWHEGSILFAPTYKYMINSDIYYMVHAKEVSKRRAPAWCDRILWHGKGLKQLSYVRCESKLSDHRPVRSIFMVEVESLKSLQD